MAPLGVLLLFQRPSRREAVIGLLLLAFTAWALSAPSDGFERVEAAWVCLLAGGVVVTVGFGAQETRGRLVMSGLLAVGVAAVAGLLILAVTPFSWSELVFLASHHYRLFARSMEELMARQLEGSPGAPDVAAAVQTIMGGIVAIGTRVLPALVLLQSMGALAVAWAVYRWLVRHPEGDPLPRLREFRFSDQLIWGVVLALIALVLPGQQVLHLIGGNLAMFFGGLYMVRGLGIVAAIAAAAGIGGPIVAILASLATVLLWPLVIPGALALGVTDTWVDWRKLASKARKT